MRSRWQKHVFGGCFGPSFWFSAMSIINHMLAALKSNAQLVASLQSRFTLLQKGFTELKIWSLAWAWAWAWDWDWQLNALDFRPNFAASF